MVYEMEDYLIESLRYELYMLNKNISEVHTKACIDEAHILTDYKIQCEGHIDKVDNIEITIVESGYDILAEDASLKDIILSKIPGGTIHTGKFELLRPKLLKMARTAKNMDRIKYLRRDIQMGYKQLEKLKRNKPEFADSIDKHIKWLKTEYAQALNDRAKELKNTIKEETLLSINMIHEAEKFSVIEIFKALVKKLQEIWNSFMSRNKDRLKDDLPWLTENKDKILNNKYLGSKEMPKFWEKMGEINKVKIPDFNYSNMKSYLGSDEAFIKQYFPDFYENEKQYTDVAKGLFTGDSVVVRDNQMPIDKMYNYCAVEYKNMVNKIKPMFDKCINAAQQVIKDVQAGTFHESAICLERYFYSCLYEEVLYEEDLSKDTDTQNSNTSTNNNTTADDAKQQEADREKQKNKDSQEIQKLANRYITICTNINAVVMKTCDNIYDTYFAILRQHAMKNGAKNKSKKTDKNTEEPKK